jgi:hypothetical protein
VLGQIQARGLSRDDFRWNDATTGTGRSLASSNITPSFTGPRGCSSHSTASPASSRSPASGIILTGGTDVGVPRIKAIDGWSTQIDGFSGWLDRLKDELDVPDLWVELGHDDRAVFTVVADSSVENTPFTEDEREAIAKVLAELTAEVTQSFALTAA